MSSTPKLLREGTIVIDEANGELLRIVWDDKTNELKLKSITKPSAPLRKINEFHGKLGVGLRILGKEN